MRSASSILAIIALILGVANFIIIGFPALGIAVILLSIAVLLINKP
jgi:hypothetical protein